MHIRANFLAAAAAFVLAGCGGGGDSGTGPDPDPVTPPPATASNTVVAGANSNDFTPQELSITVGQTVTWSFGARPHNVTFRTASGAPSNVPNTTNAKVSRTFDAAGTFQYDCTLHSGMTGTVQVQAASY